MQLVGEADGIGFTLTCVGNADRRTLRFDGECFHLARGSVRKPVPRRSVSSVRMELVHAADHRLEIELRPRRVAPGQPPAYAAHWTASQRDWRDADAEAMRSLRSHLEALDLRIDLVERTEVQRPPSPRTLRHRVGKIEAALGQLEERHRKRIRGQHAAEPSDLFIPSREGITFAGIHLVASFLLLPVGIGIASALAGHPRSWAPHAAPSTIPIVSMLLLGGAGLIEPLMWLRALWLGRSLRARYPGVGVHLLGRELLLFDWRGAAWVIPRERVRGHRHEIRNGGKGGRMHDLLLATDESGRDFELELDTTLGGELARMLPSWIDPTRSDTPSALGPATSRSAQPS